jgi:hypothetical protein
MLSGQELSATFLVHGGWTERTIGLAGGHFGEKASVVLLLLMIVAEFPLTLCRHPTLCLHHLFHFIGASLEPLRSIKALHTGVRVHPCAVKIAN